MKKIAGDIIFYTCAPKITIHDVIFLRYKVRQTKFFFILGDFLPLNQHPTPPPPNQNFEKKMKTMPGDIIFLYINVKQ